MRLRPGGLGEKGIAWWMGVGAVTVAESLGGGEVEVDWRWRSDGAEE